jgi:hypothetical protein
VQANPSRHERNRPSSDFHRRTLLAVPPEIEPPALARLLDFAERPRVEDWSLRAALVRYASPQPQRVNDLLDLVRRLEWALGKHAATLERDGEELWNALRDGTGSSAEQTYVVELLRAARELDQLGDVLAAWAVDISADRPDAQVDAVIVDVAERLERLGVPHEDRPRPPRQRGV